MIYRKICIFLASIHFLAPPDHQEHASMQQLSPQDAVFLSMETPELPSHVGGVAFLEPSEGPEAFYERFVDFIRERLKLCDRFTWRLQEVPFGLDRPYWVEQQDFDAADHIQRVAVPAPGGQREIGELTGLLFERPIDRSRPLWEMFLIEGLSGGRCVLLWKVHHCLMDGASGASLTEEIFDISPQPMTQEKSSVADSSNAGRVLAPREIVENAIRNASALPLRQVEYAERSVKRFLRSRRGGSGEAAEQGEPNSAPRAIFNGRVGRRRRLTWSTVSLDDVKKVKNALSVTVNDVVLAITSGALRTYLADRNALPDETLIASVPSSTRKPGDHSIGNQVRDLAIPWATDLEDPIERLLQIHRDANAAKADAAGDYSNSWMGMMADTLLPGALGLMIRGAAALSDRIPLPANAVVSNVPMAPMPLYCAGARLTQLVPFSLLAPTQGLNITVVSYCGELHFGLAHDPDLLPDAWSLAEQIPKDFQRLQGAVDKLLAL
jgi:diacylglycerol O-acyltransferase